MHTHANPHPLILYKSVCTHTYTRTYTYIHCTYALQTSVDGAEVLLKKHEDFEMTAAAHDEKIKALCEQASRLIQAGHYDSAG